ncbi:MAG TPA: DUF4142 domain-containing protein [Verrucomicrobiae bacterium]|nr:DUF4142 domain-containing protein [Verrucomicrobiae bacterium]
MKLVHSAALAVSLSLILAPSAYAADTADQDKMKPSGAMQMLMDDDAKDFFETAASANMLEIDASKLALERATDPALKTYAQMMVKDHTKASGELMALAKKKDVVLETKLLKRHQMMLDDLASEKQGSEFDDEYRDKMVTSHKEAVSLFDEAARDSKDPDIKAFAAKTLPTLQAHGGAAKKLPKPKG